MRSHCHCLLPALVVLVALYGVCVLSLPTEFDAEGDPEHNIDQELVALQREMAVMKQREQESRKREEAARHDAAEGPKEAESHDQADRKAALRSSADDSQSRQKEEKTEQDAGMQNVPFFMDDDKRGEAFIKADFNGDGTLSEEEFKVFVMKPMEDDHKQERELFKMGYIGMPGAGRQRRRDEMPSSEHSDSADSIMEEQKQYAREMERHKKKAEARMAKLDETTKAKIRTKHKLYEERWELRWHRMQEQMETKVNQWFPRVDTDGDGAISEEEWASAA